MQKDSKGNIIIRGPDDFKAYLAARKNKKLFDFKAGHVVVDHIATANVLAKFIELVPMDRWIKKVMLMRVGNPLMNKRQLSHMQIAITIGATVDEVIELERVGKIIVGKFLERCSAQEAVRKFETDLSAARNVNEVKNSMGNPASPASGKGV